MEAVLLDFGAVAAALGLVCAGFAAGWTLRGRLDYLDRERKEQAAQWQSLRKERDAIDAEQARLEEERRRTEAARQEGPENERARAMKAQQEAFRRLQSYSAADAYRLNDGTAAAGGGGA